MIIDKLHALQKLHSLYNQDIYQSLRFKNKSITIRHRHRLPLLVMFAYYIWVRISFALFLKRHLLLKRVFLAAPKQPSCSTLLHQSNILHPSRTSPQCRQEPFPVRGSRLPCLRRKATTHTNGTDQQVHSLQIVPSQTLKSDSWRSVCWHTKRSSKELHRHLWWC